VSGGEGKKGFALNTRRRAALVALLVAGTKMGTVCTFDYRFILHLFFINIIFIFIFIFISQCPLGYVSDPNYGFCSPCPPGQYSQDGVKCVSPIF
jgi:hypothetical protein